MSSHTKQLFWIAALLMTILVQAEDWVTALLFRSHVLDLSVKLHQFEGNGNERNLGRHEKPVKCVECDKNTGMIVTGSWDETVKLWDPRAANASFGTYKQPGMLFS